MTRGNRTYAPLPLTCGFAPGLGGVVHTCGEIDAPAARARPIELHLTARAALLGLGMRQFIDICAARLDGAHRNHLLHRPRAAVEWQGGRKINCPGLRVRGLGMIQDARIVDWLIDGVKRVALYHDIARLAVVKRGEGAVHRFDPIYRPVDRTKDIASP